MINKITFTRTDSVSHYKLPKLAHSLDMPTDVGCIDISFKTGSWSWAIQDYFLDVLV